MEITIQSVNFETSASLNEYVNKKLGKLSRFAEVSNAEVQLKLQKTTDDANKEIGIRVQAGDEQFYASKKAEAFEDAILQTVEALEKQILKSKEKKR